MNKRQPREVDYLGEIKVATKLLHGQERMDLAREAGVSLRTIDHIAAQDRDFKYSVVISVYKAIKKMEAKKVSKQEKGEKV